MESKFVWGKKKQRDKKALGFSEHDLKRRERDRKREADEELAKLNKRRTEREREMELREEEQARIQRDAELAQMGDWEAKEEEFHLEQAKTRAAIRIRDGRAKPIDILAMNLRLAYEPDKVEEEIDLEIDLDEPYTIFDVSIGNYKQSFVHSAYSTLFCYRIYHLQILTSYIKTFKCILPWKKIPKHSNFGVL